MRVCLDCRAVESGGTGVSAFARSALDTLSRHAVTHEFLVLVRSETLARCPLPENFTAIATDGAGPLWQELELPSLLKERGADVYFSPLFTCPVVRTVRQVVTLHDVFPLSHPCLCPEEFLGFWERRSGPSLRAACHVAAVSEWSKAQVVEHVNIAPRRVSVVHQSAGREFRPVSVAEATPVLERYGLLCGQYVLYVGALDPRKNLGRLQEAFVRMDGDGLHLALAGKPASREEPELETGDRVRLLGYVPDDDLPALYSSARCFAFPSLAEGFGRPCTEAMACGVPVVASDRTALPETCGRAALLPDAEDVNAIADALQTACFDDGRRAALVDAGFVRAAEFSGERFASDLLAAFRQAVDGPGEGVWPASR